MEKIANMALDLTSDRLKTVFVKIAQKLGDMPDELKGSEFMTEDDLNLLSDGDFALIVSEKGELYRRYPIVDRAHTWMSVKYFTETYSKLPEDAQVIAATNLSKAAKYFCLPISEEASSVLGKLADEHRVSKIYKAHPGETTGAAGLKSSFNNRYESTEKDKTASFMLDMAKIQEAVTADADADYAVGTGSNKHVPIKTAEQIKTAAAMFEDNYKIMAPAERYKYAKRVMTKAAELAVIVPQTNTICKYYSNNFDENVKTAIQMRKDVLDRDKHASVIAALDAIAAAISKPAGEKTASAMTPEKVACALDQLDRASGLNFHWDSPVLPDPYYSVFGIGETKMAKIAGFDITDDDLAAAAANSQILKNHFTNDMISAFESNPREFFTALPKPHQSMIVDIIHGRV